MLTTSHNMEVKKNKSHDDVFTISHTTKVRIYCLLMTFVDVGIDILFHLSIKGCMFITCAIKTPKNAPLQSLLVIGQTHGLEETGLLVLANIIPLSQLLNLTLIWRGEESLYPKPLTLPNSLQIPNTTSLAKL